MCYIGYFTRYDPVSIATLGHFMGLGDLVNGKYALNNKPKMGYDDVSPHDRVVGSYEQAALNLAAKVGNLNNNLPDRYELDKKSEIKKSQSNDEVGDMIEDLFKSLEK